MSKEKLKVDPIKNGTVIDHIEAGKALQVADILNLRHPKNELMIGMNLPSGKTGKKDILKIENRELSPEEVNSIALIAPTATLAIISDYNVVKKLSVSIPEKIDKIIVCPNPNCVTNIEGIPTRFAVAKKEPMEIRCDYCEKQYSVNNVKFLI